MNTNPVNSSRYQEAREMAGLSIEQAAKLLAFSLSDLLEIESGNLDISDEMIQKLAMFYEVDVEWLKDETSNANPKHLGNLPIAPRDLEKINSAELPKLLHILSAIRGRAHIK